MIFSMRNGWILAAALFSTSAFADFHWFNIDNKWCASFEDREMCLPQGSHAISVQDDEMQFEYKEADTKPRIGVIHYSRDVDFFDELVEQDEKIEFVDSYQYLGHEIKNYKMVNSAAYVIRLDAENSVLVSSLDQDAVRVLSESLVSQWQEKRTRKELSKNCREYFYSGCVKN